MTFTPTRESILVAFGRRSEPELEPKILAELWEKFPTVDDVTPFGQILV